MAETVRIENTTRGTLLAIRAELADRPWRRLKGLLGRAGLAPGEGLVIAPCQGVHTWFMAFPIDVLHVDRQDVVRRIVPAMGPNRVGPLVWDARYVIELPAGAADASSTEVGDRLALTPDARQA
jgi:uncharacterized protein